MMMSVLQRAKDSGKCPPSLISIEDVDSDGFGSDASQLLDNTGLGLSADPAVVDLFSAALKKATSMEGVEEGKKKAVLEQRRCLILAIVGSTPPSKVLEKIVDNGYLTTIKVWLDDVLGARIGNIDLLLHLLSNIVDLPVTKTVVKSSGMGKAIGAIEKHSACKGTPNEAAIIERVANIKEAWQKSVKARKAQAPPPASNPVASGPPPSAAAQVPPPPAVGVAAGEKRDAPSGSASGSSVAKKPKPSTNPTSSFSSLLAKVSGSNGSHSSPDRNGAKRSPPKNGDVSPKKSRNRVRWADHFGGDLEASKIIEGENVASSEVPAPTSGTVSWTDRKKRDRAREKELLASVKKAKLLDEEDDEALVTPSSVAQTPAASLLKTTVTWAAPLLIAERPDIPKPTLSSAEVETQNEREKVVVQAQYFSALDVPSNPSPLSDVEQALDMTSQSSAVVATIPFFVPQQVEAAPAPAPTENIYGTESVYGAVQQPPQPASAPAPGATPDFLQALGLPLFLVGQNVQALQTLASSPGLLSTMVDSQGMYDQNRLLSLVQTLSGPSTTPQVPPRFDSTHANPYGTAPASSYSPAPKFTSQGGMRRKSDEGNLHVSGYGPGTTQSDLITLFLPYVAVDEVVLKANFAFVNTSDPPNAQRAKEALQGTLLNGAPIRINPATRKAKDFGPPPSFGQTSTYGPAGGANPVTSFGNAAPTTVNNHYTTPQSHAFPNQQPPPPPQLQGQTTYANVDHVRDDRGNAATKNLFVAGYGQGTTEIQLRDFFSQHAQVVGVILKGNFSFVNTSHKAEAVKAREMLQGQPLNGGTLRINFAKETGRLGTSFDLTYNERSGPNARRPGPPPPQSSGGPENSYYGRGGY